MKGRFDGKVAAVTGAGSGMGLAVAVALLQEGASVIALDVAFHDEEARSLEAETTTGSCRLEVCDVTDETSVAAVMEATGADHGRLDILVNAAGISTPTAPVEQTSLADWDRTIAVNLTGPFICIKHAVPLMKALGGGSIVNFASTSASRPSAPGIAPYSASKGGVVALTRELVQELSVHGIRVNAVSPGPIRSPMTDRFGAVWRDRKASVIPMGDLGEPRDVAACVLFLVSEEARHLTGLDLVVDGGMTSIVTVP